MDTNAPHALSSASLFFGVVCTPFPARMPLPRFPLLLALPFPETDSLGLDWYLGFPSRRLYLSAHDEFITQDISLFSLFP
uniref:Uncharacterized protein n=1 Tax=Picea glauca TaxID=3330 RepID=A0A101LVZ0_PICGL|nr:hypothetical protein ABT39_MTgene1868 [Picea glauca]